MEKNLKPEECQQALPHLGGNMKIKDCMACKLDEENVINFLTDVIPNTLMYESLKDATEGWYEDSDDPEALYSTSFLDHMTKDHASEIYELCNKIETYTYKIAKEVF